MSTAEGVRDQCEPVLRVPWFRQKWGLAVPLSACYWSLASFTLSSQLWLETVLRSNFHRAAQKVIFAKGCP